jgi:hypothetical protein
MKINRFFIIAASLFFIMGSCKEDTAIHLIQGEDLGNWTVFFEDSNVNPDEVFMVEDGVLKVSGVPNGYIRTRESYSNYKLHVEWRWTAEPANSGVLVHTQGEDLFWPKSIECQLQNQNAGDIVLFQEGTGATINGTDYMIEPGEWVMVVRKFEESSENPAGEWNAYDITCEGNNIEIIVNGVLQNRASNLTLSSGQIVLQSEGGPMEFRNITLTPIE